MDDDPLPPTHDLQPPTHNLRFSDGRFFPIQRLRAVVGGSLGGHMALSWAARQPHRVAGTIAIATSPRLTSQALAFDVVGRNAILSGPAYHSGQYYDRPAKPDDGLAIARMLGHIAQPAVLHHAVVAMFFAVLLAAVECKNERRGAENADCGLLNVDC